MVFGETMRKILVLIVCLLTAIIVNAEESVQPAVQNALIVPQNIDFESCTKIYGINQEKLFYLTLASVGANRFNIEEIQTANGYILFSANRNKYIATIAKIDGTNSIIKIAPCNNVYKFPPGILYNTFKYIDINLNTEIKS